MEVAKAPEAMGLYGLFRPEPDGTRRCIYLGYGSIRRRLQGHLDGFPPEELEQSPVFWLTAHTSAIERTYASLVESLKPLDFDSVDGLSRPSPRRS